MQDQDLQHCFHSLRAVTVSHPFLCPMLACSLHSLLF